VGGELGHGVKSKNNNKARCWLYTHAMSLGANTNIHQYNNLAIRLAPPII
jgi:hypothetical protein